jgi:ubiquinone/menaquinone biosynthesis C-methylase UbiE
MESKERDIPEIREPFCSGREAHRLLFDFSILMSCILNSDNRRILDFAGGSGWVAEFLNRAGFDVTTFDIVPDISRCIKKRIEADARIDSSCLKVEISDGHKLEFAPDGYFGNIVCFDSLHHMADFRAVLSEMFRVLMPGGRAIFVEPGSRHAESKETKEFIQKYKSKDPNWIERSIVLDEMNGLARKIGFLPLRVRPFLLPTLVDYSFDDWKHFSQNTEAQNQYLRTFLSCNYEDRVIFYIDKPEKGTSEVISARHDLPVGKSARFGRAFFKGYIDWMKGLFEKILLFMKS